MTLPLPPNVANARGHWRTRKRARDKFYEACDMRQLAGNVPPPPAEPLAKATLSATLYVHNLMDHDNMYARLKPAQDWLRTRGYITDDKPKHLELGTVGQQIDRKNKRLELALLEIPRSEHLA